MNPETGSLISRAAVLRLLQSALPCGHLPQATNADDTLHDLGLDSIAMLGLLLSAAEEFSLDLAVLENITEVPSTVDDLHRFLNDLPKGNQRETA